MASNLFGPGTRLELSAADHKAKHDKALADQARRDRKAAAAAAGRDRRSIGVTR